MTLIAWPYRVLVALALGAALFTFGWRQGAERVQAKWDAQVREQAVQVAVQQQRQAEAAVKVVTRYVDRVRVVREKGEAIVKEVPVYVPVEADAACSVNRGFVRVHDAAVQGTLPAAAGDADATTSGVALSAVAGTVTTNYQTCHENAEQLRGLQGWVKETAQ